MFTINKIDTEVYGPIPDWVDKNMLPSIYQKQNTSYIFKISNIFCNSFLQQRTFVNWVELEQYLDIIIDRIKETRINFDCVVGIKTGGAIISDYISKKLNLPNYKIKVSRSEYSCNKKPIHTINDIVQKRLLKNLDKFDICKEIDTDLTDKNIILIDELVSSGFTMKKTLDYLKYNKKANIIYPTSVSFLKGLFLNNFDFNYVIPYIVFIWPWGYDNLNIHI
jgi:hypoxanthine phosphoribosyltransferase